MKRDKLGVVLLVFIFSFVTSYLLFPCPKDCVACWNKFKSSTTTIILAVEKADDNTHLISLKNLRAELEKARIGDNLIVELKLGEAEIIKMGTFSPKVITSETKILEKYQAMAKVSFKLPDELKGIPTSAQLIVRDVSGKFKSTKSVQIEITP